MCVPAHLFVCRETGVFSQFLPHSSSFPPCTGLRMQGFSLPMRFSLQFKAHTLTDTRTYAHSGIVFDDLLDQTFVLLFSSHSSLRSPHCDQLASSFDWPGCSLSLSSTHVVTHRNTVSLHGKLYRRLSTPFQLAVCDKFLWVLFTFTPYVHASCHFNTEELLMNNYPVLPCLPPRAE